MVDQFQTDWFVPVLKDSGTVSQCLHNVTSDLLQKLRLVEKIEQKIGDIVANGVDQLTNLSHRIRELENTLRFRENLNRNDKRHTWFRHLAATSSGPFSATLLAHPIFLSYDATATQDIRTKLNRCWDENSMSSYPFVANTETLWSFLLKINVQLNEINDFGEFKLENFRESILESLKSPTLLAFFHNVKAEYIKMKDRLMGCYITLFDLCEKLWQVDFKTLPSPRNEWKKTAENIRQEMKDRRATLPRLPQVRTEERIAMDFMGFEIIPSTETLRTRYIELAKTMHPDLTGGSDDKFKILAKSYRLLNTR